MDSTMRGRLHDLTLRARQLLIVETRDLLEGIYGLRQIGSLEEPATLPAIQSLEEARETRAHLEQLLADERDAGLKITEAVEKLVRETAFTWLNRLAALKMLEARGLVRQSLLKGSNSNSFKLWLTTPGNEAELRRYEAGSLPLDALGEGLGLGLAPAVRHYILRFWLACSGVFPWQAVPFLEDATARIILRRVGGGYSFVHRLLQDYLADQSEHTFPAPSSTAPSSF